MKNNSVLVTGGAGYVGSHACKALAAASYNPVTYDNLVHGHEWAVKWGPLERGDINDTARLVEVIEKYRPVAVIHFAAHAYVGESVSDPIKYYKNNVAGSLNLLATMRDHSVGNIIFSSSCATYGIPSNLPITEDTEQIPINPYGRTKLIVENMLRDFEASHGLRWVALRYFNAAGADPECEIGEDHNPETHLIPLAMNATIKSVKPLTIFGSDYPTKDGTCVRDYIHVSDLASAHVKALEHLIENGNSGAINLGNGTGYSNLEIIKTVEIVSGLAVRHEFGDRRSGDPAMLISDGKLARKILNWEPEISDLTEIIRTAWNWHQKFKTT